MEIWAYTEESHATAEGPHAETDAAGLLGKRAHRRPRRAEDVACENELAGGALDSSGALEETPSTSNVCGVCAPANAAESEGVSASLAAIPHAATPMGAAVDLDGERAVASGSAAPGALQTRLILGTSAVLLLAAYATLDNDRALVLSVWAVRHTPLLAASPRARPAPRVGRADSRYLCTRARLLTQSPHERYW
jgi:hypothetical protein